MRRFIRRGRVSESGELGIEVLAFGLLIFVTGSLIFVNGWAIVDAKLAATSAAREAARAYVESPDATAAQAAAVAAAQAAVAGYNRDPSGTAVSFGLQAFGRCQRVVVEVQTKSPLIRLPWIGQAGTVTVVARHSELVDPFRSGLPGTSSCA
jgi:hypothetical protein